MSQEQVNASLIELVRGRTERMTLGGCGIRLASDYVRGVLTAAGTDGVAMFPDAPSLLKESETRLVYRNDEMAYEPPMTSMPAIETYCKAIGVPLPPRTLMVFENIVTSSKEDRDGDVLSSEGAILDTKMPLLWHHMLPAIVGKMLAVREQNSKHVRVASAVMESPLGQDVANLIEFGALRISHGFRPLEFTPRDKGLRDRGPKGFKISSYEVMEESLVSVPSNTDAEIVAYSRGKLVTPLAKSWCRAIYEQRQKVFPSAGIGTIEVPLTVKIDIRPTFAPENPEAAMGLIEPQPQEVVATMATELPVTGKALSSDAEELLKAITDEDKRLGADAKQQAAKGDNPPNWAVDEDLWAKAKAAADKGDYDEETYWPVVVHIYQNMGGTIQGKGEKSIEPATKPEEKAMSTVPETKADGEPMKCPECDEMVKPDDEGKCPECGADMEADAKAGVVSGGKSAGHRGVKQADAMAACAEACEACKEACEACMADMTPATCKACAAACLACAKACDACNMPECDACAEVCRACAETCKAGPSDACMAACKKCMSACDKCIAACEKTGTKAGRILSADNEEKLRAALSALQAILEKIEPPAEDGNYKPAPMPTDAEAAPAQTPAETTANKPTPVELNKPDGALSLQAAAQAIVRRLMEPMSADDMAILGKLADAIHVEQKSHERAKRKTALNRLLRVRV